jgi:hypothetical protein
VDVITDYKWELYAPTDFSQADNLAATMPEKLLEMRLLFYTEAAKYNVLPLDNSKTARMASGIRPSLTEGRKSFTFYEGQTRIPEEASPDIKNKSWSLTAEVEVKTDTTGIIITQGGLFAGWALYLEKGKPVFHYNFCDAVHYEVAGKDALVSGKHTINVNFVYDGGGIGKGVPAALSVDGQVAITPFGLVGHQLLGGGWSNKERVSLEQAPSNLARLLATSQCPRLADPGPVLTRSLERFFPSLLVPTQPLNRVNQGIGVFFRFGASDGVANPIKYAYNVGIGGKGLVPGRPCDNFGIGWARTELSGNFVPFLRQQLRLGLGHEDAVELYYNAAITPWLNAALDLQIIEQALERTLDASGARIRDMNTAVVLGLRVYARF